MRLKARATSYVTVGAALLAVALAGPATAGVGASPLRGRDRAVVLAGMVDVPGGPDGPDHSSIAGRRAVALAGRLSKIVVRIPGEASAKDEAALVSKALAGARATWAKEIGVATGRTRPALGGPSPSAISTVYGNCGWSQFSLADSYGAKAAYVTAKFSIIRPGFAYRTNEHVVDPSWFDSSDWNWPETGNLNGGTSWYDSFTFYVDDAGKKYDGELDRAEVYTSNGNWCYGGDPHVYGVVIY